MEDRIIYDWRDDYIVAPTRTVLTEKELGIPGVESFGRQVLRKAEEPLPPHTHADCFEISFLASGNISFYMDGKDFNLSGGDAFITFPNELHSTNSIPMSAGELYYIKLDFAHDDSVLFLSKQYTCYIQERLKMIRSRNIKTDNNNTLKSIQRAFGLCQRKNPYYAALYITMFLEQLLEFSESPFCALTPDIGAALNWIYDHLTENISLQELARISNLSESQFKHKFKKQMGSSPRDFINHEKIIYATKIIGESTKITDLAYDLGFSSSNYFATVFKKYTYMTPTEYLDRIKRYIQDST